MQLGYVPQIKLTSAWSVVPNLFLHIPFLRVILRYLAQKTDLERLGITSLYMVAPLGARDSIWYNIIKFYDTARAMACMHIQ